MVRLGSVSVTLIAFLMAMGSTISIGAQTSGHQRIGVERKTDWEFGFELGNGMTYEVYDSSDYFTVDSYASIDMVIVKSWTASFYAPLSANLVIGDDVWKAAMVGLGDIELSAGWTNRIADTRVSASLRTTVPTGEWNPYAAAEGVLTPGSGRWSVGMALSVSRIIDPVVLGAAFAWDVGLPRAERFSTTWRPGDMSFSLSVTEVLNDRVGYSLKALQSASLPELRNDGYSLDSFSYTASMSIELWYSDGDASARFGVSKSVTSSDAPARLYVALLYTLRSENHDE